MTKSNFADQIEKKIIGAIMQIKSGKTTPAKSSIGSLLNELKKHDEAAYSILLKQYQPVYQDWKSRQESLLDDKQSEL